MAAPPWNRAPGASNGAMTLDLAPARPLRPTAPAFLVALAVAACQTFALGATGSTSAAAALAASAVHAAGLVAALLAGRWAGDDADRGATAARGAELFAAGASLTAAGFVFARAVPAVLAPPVLTAVPVGVAAMLTAVGLSLVGAAMPSVRRGASSPPTPDPTVSLVAALGLGAAGLGGGPAMDGVGAAVIAAWLAWGAVDMVRRASR